MKITKYLHSCLLIKENEKTILLDPGRYSVEVLPVFHDLDAIAITHEHPDHFDIPTVKKLYDQFPRLKIFSTESVKLILAKENIAVQTEGTEIISLKAYPHEKAWMGGRVQNVMVTLFGTLSHPGDSLSFEKAAQILALPVTAPWGSTTWAIEVAEKIKPKVIIPIHDSTWKDDFRKKMYDSMQDYFAQKGMDFRKAETGREMEV
ncbi:MAG TPA: MBL fold metallo-hydrolase [Patescibacteria group bacterium]|nr:MBL fold metallo-hydrolase [Patescibacteria group bacterium]